MDEKMRFMYDESGDLMDISIGKPKPAISEELSEGFFVRLSPRSGKIVGFMIMNFRKAFLKNMLSNRSLNPLLEKLKGD